MHKFVVLYKKPDDPDHFRDYYLNTHIPLAAELPGLRAWRYSFDVATQGETAYFAVFEGEFDDAGAMVAAMGSDQGRKVTADVPNYATGGAVIVHYPVTEGAT